jgi:hypothetical protein
MPVMANEGLYQIQTEAFSENLALNLQQEISALRGFVTEGSYVGKTASVIDYLAPVAMQAPAGRNALVNVQDNSYQRRFITPVPKELVQRIDTFDKLLTTTDPTGMLVRGTAAAVAREWDDRIIAAAFGTVNIGSSTDGTVSTTETWQQANTTLTGTTNGLMIADTFGNGSTTIGMTTEKLIEARRLFRKYHVTQPEMMAGELTLIIGSQQEADLLKQVEVVSSEFWARQILNKGSLQGEQYLGWNIHVSERLGYGTDLSGSGNGNCRQCIAFVRSGMHLGIWKDTENLISRQELVSGAPWQINTMMSSGATRLEPGRLLLISCGNDTSGADNI